MGEWGLGVGGRGGGDWGILISAHTPAICAVAAAHDMAFPKSCAILLMTDVQFSFQQCSCNKSLTYTVVLIVTSEVTESKKYVPLRFS